MRLYDSRGDKYDELMDIVLTWWTEMNPDSERQDAQECKKHRDKMPRQGSDIDCEVMVCLAMRRLTTNVFRY